jgi:hypothetical protein
MNQSQELWRPIDSAPTEVKRMFVAIAIHSPVANNYTSDPYCVWVENDGTFARWPHPFPPTHWLPLPRNCQRFPTLENAKPGDKLADGCIVINRQPKSIFHNERLLIAAPKKTEFWGEWTPEFQPVFDRLKEHGFNPSDWFIPSVEQLQLAYKNAKQHFVSTSVYWSSTEVSYINAGVVYFGNGNQSVASKVIAYCVRAFRFIELCANQ